MNATHRAYIRWHLRHESRKQPWHDRPGVLLALWIALCAVLLLITLEWVRA